MKRIYFACPILMQVAAFELLKETPKLYRIRDLDGATIERRRYKRQGSDHVFESWLDARKFLIDAAKKKISNRQAYLDDAHRSLAKAMELPLDEPQGGTNEQD